MNRRHIPEPTTANNHLSLGRRGRNPRRKVAQARRVAYCCRTLSSRPPPNIRVTETQHTPVSWENKTLASKILFYLEFGRQLPPSIGSTYAIFLPPCISEMSPPERLKLPRALSPPLPLILVAQALMMPWLASPPGQIVQQHTDDDHEETHGLEGGELEPEHDDGGSDEEDSLEGVTHGVGHRVHAAQAPEGALRCLVFNGSVTC